MGFGGLLTMLGGLALFLYGMRLMCGGLSRMSGGRPEGFLEKLTASPVKGVLAGAGITAFVQSSSAVTVMITGLVDSGVLGLEQAVGVIMGANIGTTVTSWLLVLSEAEILPLYFKLPGRLGCPPVFFVIGTIGLLLSMRDRRRNAASVLVGFFTLMFGMKLMSGAVEPLVDAPWFAGILTRFSEPALGVAAGIALTAVIQSSSASIGMLQALGSAGAVSYGTAVPIIMGQNIGTCVTALLAGAGAGLNAKRAAFVHLYFNMIGTALFLVGFYGIRAVAEPAFLDKPAGSLGIALIHSLFNIAATAALLPFSDGLVKLAYLTVSRRSRPARRPSLYQSLRRSAPDRAGS